MPESEPREIPVTEQQIVQATERFFPPVDESILPPFIEITDPQYVGATAEASAKGAIINKGILAGELELQIAVGHALTPSGLVKVEITRRNLELNSALVIKNSSGDSADSNEAQTPANPAEAVANLERIQRKMETGKSQAGIRGISTAEARQLEGKALNDLRELIQAQENLVPLLIRVTKIDPDIYFPSRLTLAPSLIPLIEDSEALEQICRIKNLSPASDQGLSQPLLELLQTARPFDLNAERQAQESHQEALEQINSQALKARTAARNPISKPETHFEPTAVKDSRPGFWLDIIEEIRNDPLLSDEDRAEFDEELADGVSSWKVWAEMDNLVKNRRVEATEQEGQEKKAELLADLEKLPTDRIVQALLRQMTLEQLQKLKDSASSE